jgi:RNA polymerase-binding transcription factor DksA
MAKIISPLKPEDIAHYKRQLQDRLDELTNRLDKIENQLVETPEPDWEDAAKNAEDTEVLESLGNAGLKEIDGIKAALQRIELGTYGICVKSGEIIPRERLDLIPWTPFCEDHAH